MSIYLFINEGCQFYLFINEWNCCCINYDFTYQFNALYHDGGIYDAHKDNGCDLVIDNHSTINDMFFLSITFRPNDLLISSL